MKLNVEKWNQDRIKAETEIKELKRKIRREPKPVMEWSKEARNFVPTGATYCGPTWEEHKRLVELKKWATSLYQVRAHARGRQHGSEIADQVMVEAYAA